MDESKWAFVQENWGLVLAVAEMWRKRVGNARKDGSRNVEWDELVSGALDLALKCMRSYDPEKSVFSTYYYRAAQNPFRHVIFKTEAREGGGKHMPLDSIQKYDADVDQDERRTLRDTIGCDSTPTDEEALSSINSRMLHEAIARLPDDLRRHAHETLEGKVQWKRLAYTVELRRRMLKALREELS